MVTTKVKLDGDNLTVWIREKGQIYKCRYYHAYGFSDGSYFSKGKVAIADSDVDPELYKYAKYVCYTLLKREDGDK